MNTSYFIAKRLRKIKGDSFSSIVVRIASFSVAIAIAFMIICYAILGGFREKIKNKIFSFEGHVQVTKYTITDSYELPPVSTKSNLYQKGGDIDGVTHIQAFAQKWGMLKAEEQIAGVFYKGVAEDFNLDRFQQNMKAGRFINLKDTTQYKKVWEVVLSERIARKLKLAIEDTVLMFTGKLSDASQNPNSRLRVKRLKVVGIYETSMEDFDDRIIFGDLGLVQQLNKWEEDQVSGYEIFVNTFDEKKRLEIDNSINYLMDYDMGYRWMQDKYIQVFEWLDLLNRNVLIFLVIILVVAILNMVSTLLIMILERTNMIGTLKAIGASNYQIRDIFIQGGFYITLWGLVIGNGLALGYCALQYHFGIIQLDPENYYMKEVPILWDWLLFAELNALIIAVIFVVLFFTTFIINRIRPIKAIRFD